MNHEFPPLVFEDGYVYTMSKCIHCGATAKIYKRFLNEPVFYDKFNNRLRTIPPCKSVEREKFVYKPTGSILDGVNTKKTEIPQTQHTDTMKPGGESGAIDMGECTLQPDTETGGNASDHDGYEISSVPKIESNESSLPFDKSSIYKNQPVGVIHTGKHRWIHQDIPDGEYSVDEPCACGVISTRYASNGRLYRMLDGTVKSKPVNGCSILPVVIKKEPKPPREKATAVEKSPGSPRHSWDKKEIPDGELCVVQPCVNCGAISKWYETGFRQYYDIHGKVTTSSSPCINRSTHTPDPAIVLTAAAIVINRGPSSEPGIITKEVAEVIKEADEKGPGREIPMAEKHIGHKSLQTTAMIGARHGVHTHITDPVLEAALFDSIVIMKVVFEELVKNNIYSPGREMMGRFLYSNGCSEIVKQLDNRFQPKLSTDGRSTKHEIDQDEN